MMVLECTQVRTVKVTAMDVNLAFRVLPALQFWPRAASAEHLKYVK